MRLSKRFIRKAVLWTTLLTTPSYITFRLRTAIFGHFW